MFFENIFQEIAFLLLVSSIVGALVLWIKQPLILAYITVGIIIGPSLLGIVKSNDEIDFLAKIGISVLLFVVGLKLDLKLIKTMGKIALATGFGQVLFTSIFGYLICIALGFSQITSIYIAVALTFSSTIIIVKLLSDKREIDSLHGRIAVGFLIVQDILVVIAMIILTTFSLQGASDSFLREILNLSLKGGFFLISVAILMKYLLPRLLHFLARSRELLVLFSISWAVFLAVTGEILGFSKEIGAFVAGVSLASTPYREAIVTRLINLRDFLLLFFFIDLGAKLNIHQLGSQITPAVILSLFVLIGNPLIVMIIMGIMGYSKRTGFLAGLTVAQISEFSLILGALGVSLGHINEEALGVITMVGILTIGLSSYMILYSHSIYKIISPYLRIFEKKNIPKVGKSENIEKALSADFIIFGMGRYGSSLARNLRDRGYKIFGFDFDPEAVSLLSKDGFNVCYGDAEDPECLVSMSLSDKTWVISAIPNLEVNMSLLSVLKERGYGGKKAFIAYSEEDAEGLKKAGADLVLFPFVDAAERAVEKILLDFETKSHEFKSH